MALDLTLPKHLLVHGFWTNSGAKISKSNAKSLVDPVPYVAKFGPDAAIGHREFVAASGREDLHSSRGVAAQANQPVATRSIGSQLAIVDEHGHRLAPG